MTEKELGHIKKAAKALRESSKKLWGAWYELSELRTLHNTRCAIADTVLDIEYAARKMEQLQHDIIATARAKSGGA